MSAHVPGSEHTGVRPHPRLKGWTVSHEQSIWTRQGNEVALLGRVSISELWVVRKSDNALRRVLNSNLLCEDAKYLVMSIAILPKMKPATAKLEHEKFTAALSKEATT